MGIETNTQTQNTDSSGIPPEVDMNQLKGWDANGVGSPPQVDGDQTNDANQTDTGSSPQVEENQSNSSNQTDAGSSPQAEKNQSNDANQTTAETPEIKDAEQSEPNTEAAPKKRGRGRPRKVKPTDEAGKEKSTTDPKAKTSEGKGTGTKSPRKTREKTTAKSQVVNVQQIVVPLKDVVKLLQDNNGSLLAVSPESKSDQNDAAQTSQSAATDGSETSVATQNPTVDQDSVANDNPSQDEQNHPQQISATAESDTGNDVDSQVAANNANQAVSGSIQHTDNRIETATQNVAMQQKSNTRPGILRRLLDWRFGVACLLLLVIILQNGSFWKEISWDTVRQFIDGSPTVADSDFIPAFSDGGLNSGLRQDLQLPSGLFELNAGTGSIAANNPATPFANGFGLPASGDMRPVQSATDILSNAAKPDSESMNRSDSNTVVLDAATDDFAIQAADSLSAIGFDLPATGDNGTTGSSTDILSNEVKLDSDLLDKIERSLVDSGSPLEKPTPIQSQEFGTTSTVGAGDFSGEKPKPDNPLNYPPFTGPLPNNHSGAATGSIELKAESGATARYFSDLPSPNRTNSQSSSMDKTVIVCADSAAGACQRISLWEALVARSPVSMHATMQEDLELLAADLGEHGSYDENAVRAFQEIAMREFTQLALDDAESQSEFADGESIVRNLAGKFNEVAGSLGRQFGLPAAAGGFVSGDSDSVFLRKSWNILDGTVLTGISHDGATATLKLQEHYVNVSEGDSVPNAGQVVEIANNGDYWEVRTSTGGVFSSKPAK